MLAAREVRAQPKVAWGTYVGGQSGDIVVAIAADAAGNIYAAGNTTSTDGIATPGTHQVSISDSSDAFVMKFDPTGKRLWGTYFGGSGFDQTLALAVRDDVVVVGGETDSPDGIATANTFQTAKNFGDDGFVARFTSEGKRVWATYVGSAGSAEDHLWAVDIGSQGEVYVCGDLIGGSAVADATSHQPNFGGGESDAFLLRLDGAGAKVWGTYYGGSGLELGESVAYQAGGMVFISGTTRSTSNIATDGAFQPKLQKGSTNMFVAAFDSDGVRHWGTYFGDPGQTQHGVVAAYLDGGVVLVGSTASPGLATDGTVLAGVDAIVTRFDALGGRTWSTYFGGDDHETNYAVTVGPDGAIYLGGYTFSTSGLASPDAFKTGLGGLMDAYVAKLSGTGQRIWSTYYGGEKEDYGLDLAFVKDRLTMGGSTGSLTGIASPGAHQTELGYVEDGFLVQIVQSGQPLGGPCADPQTCASKLCVDGVCCDSACGDGNVNDCQACSVAKGAPIDGSCKPRGEGKECRLATDECDGVEACDGVTIVCPPDEPAPDGSPCVGGMCSAWLCLPDEENTSATDTSTSTGGDTSTSIGGDTSTSTGGTTSTGTTNTGGTGGDTSAGGTTSASTGTPGAMGPTTGGTADTAQSTLGTSNSTGAGDDTATTPDTESGGCNGCNIASSPGFAGLLLALALRRRRASR